MVPANKGAPRANGGQCDTTGSGCADDATPQPDAIQAAQHPKDSLQRVRPLEVSRHTLFSAPLESRQERNLAVKCLSTPPRCNVDNLWITPLDCAYGTRK